MRRLTFEEHGEKVRKTIWIVSRSVADLQSQYVRLGSSSRLKVVEERNCHINTAEPAARSSVRKNETILHGKSLFD